MKPYQTQPERFKFKRLGTQKSCRLCHAFLVPATFLFLGKTLLQSLGAGYEYTASVLASQTPSDPSCTCPPRAICGPREEG